MNARRLRDTWCLGAALALVAPVAAPAATWPVIEAPPGAHVEWVAENMHVNGLPMRVRRFTTAMSVEQVMAFYLQRWRGTPPPVENRVGDWRVIGRQAGDFYLTVQTRTAAGGETEGFLGVSKLPAAPDTPKLDTRFPRLDGTEVLSDVSSRDDGRLGKTLVLHNTYSVQSNASFYEGALPNQGWKRNAAFGGAERDRRVLYFQRRDESAALVIAPHPEGGTAIVVNIVSPEAWR